ncbi:follicle cell protein 3C-1 [Drosophila obscura]|uniref:follicle cell protein 3C-1 n=1 Tax=Drosophila obscura TaxID=7282 RepID=UPI001BB0E8A0|nr:follicle cell protein 3C-1 [Drosophila obscura]
MKMACHKMSFYTMLLPLLLILLDVHLEASKIAYKKPLYGKGNYIKDKRMRSKPVTIIPATTATPTTEAAWPAAVEFIIVTTARPEFNNNTTEASPSHIANGSTTEAFSTSSQATAPETPATTTTATTTAANSLDNTLPLPPTPAPAAAAAAATNLDNHPVPCTCGVFLSSQMQHGLQEAPLIHQELDRMFACNAIGRKQCQTKCLEAIVQHLPNSANIVCSALGHDCHKERAYLFIKNCHNQWVNTNLQAGREYCCKAGVPYRCPLLG